MKLALNAGVVAGAVFPFAAGAAFGFIAHGERSAFTASIGNSARHGAAVVARRQQTGALTMFKTGLRRTGLHESDATGRGW